MSEGDIQSWEYIICLIDRSWRRCGNRMIIRLIGWYWVLLDEGCWSNWRNLGEKWKLWRKFGCQLRSRLSNEFLWILYKKLFFFCRKSFSRYIHVGLMRKVIHTIKNNFPRLAGFLHGNYWSWMKNFTTIVSFGIVLILKFNFIQSRNGSSPTLDVLLSREINFEVTVPLSDWWSITWIQRWHSFYILWIILRLSITNFMDNPIGSIKNNLRIFLSQFCKKTIFIIQSIYIFSFSWVKW